jgi:hypothetical protein
MPMSQLNSFATAYAQNISKAGATKFDPALVAQVLSVLIEIIKGLGVCGQDPNSITYNLNSRLLGWWYKSKFRAFAAPYLKKVGVPQNLLNAAADLLMDQAKLTGRSGLWQVFAEASAR